METLTPKSDTFIIAEFMGGWNESNYTKHLGMNVPQDGNPRWEDQWYDFKDMQYHTSPAWLIPACQKFFTLMSTHQFKDRASTEWANALRGAVERKVCDFMYSRATIQEVCSELADAIRWYQSLEN